MHEPSRIAAQARVGQPARLPLSQARDPQAQHTLLGESAGMRPALPDEVKRDHIPALGSAAKGHGNKERNQIGYGSGWMRFTQKPLAVLPCSSAPYTST